MRLKCMCACSPCEKLRPLLKPDPLAKKFPETISAAWSAEGMAMLWRTENEGMDFGAHNVSPVTIMNPWCLMSSTVGTQAKRIGNSFPEAHASDVPHLILINSGTNLLPAS